MDSDEVLWNTYSTVNEWIRFSDTKAALILAFYGAVGAFSIPGIIDHMRLINDYAVLQILLALGIAISIISTLLSLIALAPTLRIKDIKNKNHSLLYFQAISDNFNDSSEYSKSIEEMLSNESESHRQVSEQIWANSKVASKKYMAVTWSVWFLIGSITIGIAFILTSLLIS